MPTAWEPCPGKVKAAVIGAPNVPNIAKVAPKDTGWPQYVKQRHKGAGSIKLPNAGFGPVSLAIAVKIRINRAIRGSRPGAERTVSAISPFGRS
jgi:hypothetical protein